MKGIHFEIHTNDGTHRPARIPDGVRAYAIGDIHGCDAQLAELQAKISQDVKTMPAGMVRRVIYLGDYVDRGPGSKAVVERLRQEAKENTIHLMGNHEQLMLDFIDGYPGGESWLRVGGAQTLESYGVRPKSGSIEAATTTEIREELTGLLPEAHDAFLRELRSLYRLGDFVFVHAGIDPDFPIEAQKVSDLLWVRNKFLDSKLDHGCIIVHGHTVRRAPQVFENRLGIDTGAFATGVLTCAVFEGETVRFLSAGDAHVAGQGRV